MIISADTIRTQLLMHWHRVEAGSKGSMPSKKPQEVAVSDSNRLGQLQQEKILLFQNRETPVWPPWKKESRLKGYVQQIFKTGIQLCDGFNSGYSGILFFDSQAGLSHLAACTPRSSMSARGKGD